MGNPIIPVALLGGALILLGGKKRSRPRSERAQAYQVPEAYGIPESFHSAPSSESTWLERQRALKTISQVEFGSVPLCSKCDPGSIDGEPGPKTRSAIKAFQAIAGISVDGDWSTEEDLAMFRILSSIKEGKRIECDPLLGYPAPFACFASDEGFVLELAEQSPSESVKPSKVKPEGKDSQYGPEDLLVTDPECNYVVHQDDRWFPEQKRRTIIYALAGMTDAEAALEVHESMMADYAPLCLSLGREGVGPGLKVFWNVNAGWINNLLMQYEALPQLLEEDAKAFGLL